MIQTFLADVSQETVEAMAAHLSTDKRIVIAGSATDGWKAVCYASALQPNLVIVNLHMPGMDGAEIVRHLKQRPNPPTVFVITADESLAERARCLLAGADAFLVRTEALAAQLCSAIQSFWPSASMPSLPFEESHKIFRRRG